MPSPERPTQSVFTQPDVAYDVMRIFAAKCRVEGGGRCKSCAFLLKTLDEIKLLREQLTAVQAGYANVTF